MLIANRNYLSDLISENTRFRIHRLHKTHYAPSVICKTTRNPQPGPNEIAQLRNEYQILQEISDIQGLPRVLAFEVETHSCTLVLEDFQGNSLSELLKAGPFVLNDFFNIAIQILEIISEIHARNLVHCDLKPQNILYNFKSNKVQIIDFGLARRLIGRGQFSNEASGATLAYIAPEQTGRVNRRIDHRTDFYILGVGFYEMLTGVLPFTGQDALEWVHAHIAKKATPVHVLHPEVPLMLSRVVEKMMSKAAEDRYQSAEGLMHDLRLIRDNIAEGQIQQQFDLGSADHSGRFLLTQKLVGRETEFEALEQAWRASHNGRQQVLVSGPSGSGKTALIREFARTRIADQGMFAYGKFDSRQTTVPLSAISAALNDMIQQCTSWPEERRIRLAARVRTELEESFSVLLPVVPALTAFLESVDAASANGQLSKIELVRAGREISQDTVVDNVALGEPRESTLRLAQSQSLVQIQPQNQSLDSTEGQAQDHEGASATSAQIGSSEEVRAWQKASLDTLLKILLEFVGRITVFYDDIQFIDEASATLITKSLESRRVDGIFVVAAFREDEAEASPHLAPILEVSRKSVGHSQLLTLGDLNVNDVVEFVSDTLHMPPADVRELSEAIHQKAGGNPFFMNQIFKSLADEGLISTRPGHGWQWDITEIRKREMPNNVLDLLSNKIRLLSKQVRDVLKIGSCFSKSFFVSDISAMNGADEAVNRKLLILACEAGMLFPETEVKFRFVHERVREMVYKLMRPDARREIHAKLGMSWLARIQPNSPREELYEALAHATLGVELIKEPESRALIARFSLTAARAARESAAFDLALGHANGGIRAYGQTGWESDFPQLFQLYLLKAEMEFLTGQTALAEQSFAYLGRKARGQAELSRLTQVHISLLIGRGMHQEAILMGLKCLQELGVNVPLHPSKFSILKDEVNLRIRMAIWGMPDLNVKPSSSGDLVNLSIRTLLIQAGQAAYFVNKPLFAKLNLYGCLRTFRRGLEEYAALDFFFFGLYISRIYGQFVQALEITELIIALPKGAVSKRALALVKFGRAAFLGPITMPWDQANVLLEESFIESRRAGELGNAGFACLYLAYYSLYSGEPLSEISAKVHERMEYLKDLNAILYASSLGAGCFLRALCSMADTTERPAAQAFGDPAVLEIVKRQESENPDVWFTLHQFFVHIIYQETELAAACVPVASRAHDVLPFSLSIGFFDLFYCLWVRDYARLQGRKMKVKERLRGWQCKRRIARWMLTNPRNYAPMLALIEAEEADFDGDMFKAMKLYEQAIKISTQDHSWFFMAVAFERTARFYARLQQTRISQLYVKDAIYAYQRWGADRKVHELEKEFPGLVINLVESDPYQSSTQPLTLPAQLDMKSASKAAQALSSELNMTDLLRKLMQIMIENAGAERGVVLLKEQTEFVAQKLVEGESLEYPDSLVQAVLRTGESVVLDPEFRNLFCRDDEYMTGRPSLSAMSIPLKSKGEIVGILYLEHNSATDVFTAERLELLKIILGQASISLENARLYSEVTDKVRMASELATARAVQETLFPPGLCEEPEFQVAGFYEPASECGGDWWYYHRSGDKLFVYIGDATGHGAPAALITSAARAAVSLLSQMPDLTPAKAMNLLNRAIYDTSKGSMNMTFLICSFDFKQGELCYANASHEPPFYLREQNLKSIRGLMATQGEKAAFAEFKSTFEPMNEVNGPRLGESVEVRFAEARMRLEPGDTLISATDGLWDLTNREGRAWGNRRFLKTLFKSVVESFDGHSVVADLVRETIAYREGQPLMDDVTVAVVQAKHLEI